MDMSEVDERGQRGHLSLSRSSMFVYAEVVASTHNLHFVKPEVIVEEVRWVIGSVGERKRTFIKGVSIGKSYLT